MKPIFLNDAMVRHVICIKKADGLEVGEKYTLLKILRNNDSYFVNILENPGVNYLESYFAEDEYSKLSAIRRYLKERGTFHKRICIFTLKTAPVLLLGEFYKVFLKNYKAQLENMNVGDILVFGASTSWEANLCDVKLHKGKYNVNPVHFFVQRCEKHFELHDCSKLRTCVDLVPFSGKSI